MNQKVPIAILLLILFVLLAFNIYTFNQNEVQPPAPSPSLPASIPPVVKDGPRSQTKNEDPVIYNPQVQKVDLRNFAANPQTLTIKKNTIVTFTNYDKDPHQIVGDKWKGMPLKEKELFYQAFEKPGSYPYKDPQNPQLTGVIIVEN